MLGAIIGDIVGSRFEHDNYKHTDFLWFDEDRSTYTDDTICTVAVAEAILKDADFSSVLRRYGRKHPNPCGGYGASFFSWIHSDEGPYYSFGNGSAMRVSPCGFIENHDEAMKLAELSAACTHNHPEGIKGALCVADIIWNARHGADKARILDIASKRYGYSIDRDIARIRAANRFNETCMVTVPQAISCLLESNDFESAVRTAVSIGGDSDTLAAITGSMAEALYRRIPMSLRVVTFALPLDFILTVNEFYQKFDYQYLQQ